MFDYVNSITETIKILVHCAWVFGVAYRLPSEFQVSRHSFPSSGDFSDQLRESWSFVRLYIPTLFHHPIAKNEYQLRFMTQYEQFSHLLRTGLIIEACLVSLHSQDIWWEKNGPLQGRGSSPKRTPPRKSLQRTTVGAWMEWCAMSSWQMTTHTTSVFSENTLSCRLSISLVVSQQPVLPCLMLPLAYSHF